MVLASGRFSAAGAPLSAALRWMQRRHDESPCIRVRCVIGRFARQLSVLRYSVLGFGSARGKTDVSCCAVMGQK